MIQKFLFNKEFALVSFIASVFIVLSCGIPPSQRQKSTQSISAPTDVPIPVTTPGTTSTAVDPINLYVFGGPPCAACNHEIPELRDRYRSEFAGRTDRLNITIYVPCGLQLSDQPTLAITEQWSQTLNSGFPMVNDPWRYKTYKKYIDMSGKLPAAVILNSSGSVLQKFPNDMMDLDKVFAKLHELIL